MRDVRVAGPLAAGAIAWRYRGELRVTVIVKATFAVVSEGRMTARAPLDVARHDVAFDCDPTRDIERGTDLVPYRPRADVTFVGHAHAPHRTAVPSMAVRLGLHRGAPLFERVLHVVGDRLGGAPAPFARMPVRHERGAPGFGRATATAANFLDPADVGRSAAYGPLRAAVLAASGAIVEVPDDFDWASLQSAPAPQRVPHLVGDEWLVLEGLHPTHPRLRTQLPGARAVARVTRLGSAAAGSPIDVALVADTLAIDGDAEAASLVWRGSFPADSEAELTRIDVAAALEWPGAPVTWPALPVTKPPAHLAATRPLDRGQHDASARQAVTPFVAGAAPTPAPAVERPRVPARLGLTSAMSSSEQLRAAASRAIPYAPDATPASSPSPEVPPAPVSPPARATCPKRTTPAVPIVNASPFAITTMPWQVSPPDDSLTVIVKGTFDLGEEGAAVPREPDPVSGDVHVGDDARQSLAYPSDFVVYKPRADVTLAAVARGGGRGVSVVSFAFGSRENCFERRLAVFGERRWQSGIGGAKPSPPAPFDEVPLVYERAFGGVGYADNPVGTGHADASRLPQIEDPARLVTSPSDKPPPASFGPLHPAWRERHSKVGTYGGAWFSTRWPYFPVDFDWEHEQAAPRAQQLAWLAGDEPFEVRGLAVDRPIVRGRLPELRPRCLLELVDGSTRELTLRLDTVNLDLTRSRLHLVWRAVAVVRDDEASDVEAVLVAVERMSEAPEPVEAIRQRCLVVKQVAPVDLPQPAPTNDTDAPHPDAVRMKAEVDARVEAARVELGKRGVTLPDVPLASAPPRLAELPAIDVAAVVEALRARGVDPAHVAQAERALGDAERARKDALEPDPAAVPARDGVVAAIALGRPLAGVDLQGASLSGLDLSGLVLAGCDLRGATLDGCRLVGADLTDARLGGASLVDAKLDGATLDGADFAGARLDGATMAAASVAGACFADVTGAGVDASRTRGAAADFGGASLPRARFDEAVLPRANFTRAKLEGASFRRAKMEKMQLFEASAAGARFDGATIPGARADEARCDGASFEGADISGSTWERARLERAIFRAADARGAGFLRASCRGASFAGADLRGARLSRADLSDASLLKAHAAEAALDRADLSLADLRGACLYGAETWKAKLTGAKLDLAQLAATKLAKERA